MVSTDSSTISKLNIDVARILGIVDNFEYSNNKIFTVEVCSYRFQIFIHEEVSDALFIFKYSGSFRVSAFYPLKEKEPSFSDQSSSSYGNSVISLR